MCYLILFGIQINPSQMIEREGRTDLILTNLLKESHFPFQLATLSLNLVISESKSPQFCLLERGADLGKCLVKSL